MDIKLKAKTKEYLLIILGVIVYVLGVQGIIVPTKLALGGVGGLAIIAHYLFGTPIGMITILLNIPLYFWGYRSINKDFILKTLFAVTLSSVLIDLVQGINIIQVDDPLLGALFGGLVVGIGGGICYAQGGSVGGADIVCKAVNRKYGIGVGQVGLGINVFIISLAALFVGPKIAMYTVIYLFVSAKVIDAIQTGLPTKIVFIISSKSDDIIEAIVEEIGRGATVLKGEGAYTQESKNVLMCAVHWGDIYRLKKMVAVIDPTAFIMISEASEILGKGFRSAVEN